MALSLIVRCQNNAKQNRRQNAVREPARITKQVAVAR
jgi:hypothetical protein